MEISEPVVDITAVRFPLLDTFATRQARPARHGCLVGRADELEDDLSLIEVRLALQDWAAFKHLGKNTTCTPHINGWSVASELEKQFRGAVPACNDQGSVVANSEAVSLSRLGRGTVIVSRETKVGNLQDTAVVDENVGSLHVAMENVTVMKISQTFQQLKHVAFNLAFGEANIGVGGHAGEIVVHVWRDHVEGGPFLDIFLVSLDGHLVEVQDVDMGQHLEQLDLAQSGDGETVLLVVDQDLFEGNNGAGALG